MSDDFSNTQTYYDAFSETYEKERYEGYHLLIDELELACLLGYIEEKVVLEAGCGTGLLLQPISLLAKEAHGIDISEGMLKHARKKGLNVYQASVTEVPFDDNYFDLVCSFKVLAHVEEIEKALKELIRVTKPGGALKLEFYNTKSIRYLIKKIKNPTMTSREYSDEDVFTRYDTLNAIKSYLPETAVVEKVEGVRIFTPFALVCKLPLISKIFASLEKRFRDSFLASYGGFLVVTIRKHDD
jgi:ubiquinone/menaquinone biosynthesis C-methylase UbiE